MWLQTEGGGPDGVLQVRATGLTVILPKELRCMHPMQAWLRLQLKKVASLLSHLVTWSTRCHAKAQAACMKGNRAEKTSGKLETGLW